MKKILLLIGTLIFLIAAIYCSGCITGTTADDKNSTGTGLLKQTNQTGISDSSSKKSYNSDARKETESSKGTDDRYYYNIRIVEPSDLETMSKELESDESLIHNKNDDLIGIVSPRKLYLRGDLVQLQKTTGKSVKKFEKTDIANHLMDIAFGMDNSKLTLLKSDKDYAFWFDAGYTQSDVNFVKNFSMFFNSLSQTTQFNDDNEVILGFLQTNYATIPYNYYNIKIVTEKMLDDYKDDKVATDLLIKNKEGTLVAIFSPDHIYMLDTLKEDDRQYYMLKGIMYSMGLHGTAYNDKDSFFYKEETNRNLSSLDIEALKLLYGGGLKSGMTLEESKKTLGLET